MSDKKTDAWHVGYVYGLLNGIRLRDDVSEEVREICTRAINRYKKETNIE